MGLAALAVLVVLAAVPLLGGLDVTLDAAVGAWRTCRGVALADLVSDLVTPVGVGVLGVAVARALWLGRPEPLEVARVLLALGTGVVLVGELKNFLDRPRPGAEFLGSGGGSFPSGHVGNTVLNGLAILTLWRGGVPAQREGRGWLVLVTVVTVVAVARVYGRRHWPSDVLGTAAVATAYGLLAIVHALGRVRIGLAAVALVAAGMMHLAASSGVTPADFRAEGNLLTFDVRGGGPGAERAGGRQVAFSELTLHAAEPPVREPACEGEAPCGP